MYLYILIYIHKQKLRTQKQIRKQQIRRVRASHKNTTNLRQDPWQCMSLSTLILCDCSGSRIAWNAMLISSPLCLVSFNHLTCSSTSPPRSSSSPSSPRYAQRFESLNIGILKVMLFTFFRCSPCIFWHSIMFSKYFIQIKNCPTGRVSTWTSLKTQQTPGWPFWTFPSWNVSGTETFQLEAAPSQNMFNNMQPMTCTFENICNKKLEGSSEILAEPFWRSESVVPFHNPCQPFFAICLSWNLAFETFAGLPKSETNVPKSTFHSNSHDLHSHKPAFSAVEIVHLYIIWKYRYCLLQKITALTRAARQQP